MRTFRLIIFLLTLISFTFLAFGCKEPVSIPESKESAVLKLETVGYLVTELSLEEDGVTGAINASKKEGSNYDGIMIIWFEDENTAIEYEKDWVDSKYQVKKRYGVLVYYGTERAVKDFEKAQ